MGDILGDVTVIASPGEMYNVADSIQHFTADISKNIREISDLVKDTRFFWRGDASDSERKRFENENENFNTILKNLDNYSSELRLLASNYELSESANIEESSQLPTDIFN